MRKIFNSQFRITQKFAVNPEYYKQFGLKGHEGLDVVPTGADWTVLCLEDGVIVRDIDDATLGKNYGKNVTVWHPSIGKATQYCHLAENFVKMGDRLSKGDPIGKMGSTGNTSGAHVHLNLFEVDGNGIRLNRENGYFGGIDPQPFLQETANGEVTLQEELDKARADRDRHWNALISLCDVLGVAHSPEVALAEVKKLVDLEDTLMDKEKKLTEATTKIGELERGLKKIQDVNEALLLEDAALKDNIGKQEETIIKQGVNIDTLTSQIGQLKDSANLPIFQGWRKFIVNLLSKF